MAVIGAGLLGLAAAYRLAQGGVSVTVYERDAAARRPGGHHAARRHPDRPLLPRDPAHRRARDRDRRRARARGPLPLPAQRRGLLPPGQARLDVHAARAAELPRAHRGGPACASWRSSPAARSAAATSSSRRSRSRTGSCASADGAPGRCSGGRCSTRSSTAATTTFPATYLWSRSRRMGRSRDKSSQEVMGTLDGGYQTLADALGAGHRGARRKRAPQHHRAGDRVELRPRRGHPEHARLRAARPGDLHAAAHGHGPAARPRPRRRGGPGPLPLPRHRVPGDAPAAQPQPLVHAQHHGPARAAHRRGRDHQGDRSRARGRAPRVRAEVREPGQPGARALDPRGEGRLHGSRAHDVPRLLARRRRAREPGGARAGGRARAHPRRARAAFRTCSPRRAWRWPRRRTSIQRS